MCSALLDKSDKRSKEKLKESTEKDGLEDVEAGSNDNEKVEEAAEDKKSVDDDLLKPKDENLMKLIRYLIAAGCDVNIAVS